jgi:hypothetical protein
MAFKRRAVDTVALETPQALFRDLTRKTIRGIIDYQSAILTAYQERALEAKNVAIDLPTGGGKSLVGLLIAEWRRRKFRERAVYLCPTVQLANQTALYAKDKYGIEVALLTRKIKNFSPSDKNAYQSGNSVAISTYSALFNTNPFFNDAHLLVFDDAHASENYIASLWTVEIDAREDPEAFGALAAIIDGLLSPSARAAFHASEDRLWDRAWVELLPTHKWLPRVDEFISVLDEYSADSEYRYSWSMVCHHFFACQIYLGPNVISIRPVTPPTSSFAPFTDPKQRVFMSATLGESGDLERITGAVDFLRITAPDSMLRLGLGRRFFIFPGSAQDDEDPVVIEKALITETDKALVLLPSNRLAAEERTRLESLAEYSVFGIDELEDSKAPFVDADKAVAILAGRYDGLDFPDDECRLLIIRGLPGAMELQERFLRNKASAGEFLALRIRNRVVQAVGRCTRNENDRSAIVVLEDDLLKYFQQNETRELLPLELQAEVLFGLEQSRDESAGEMVTRLRSFLDVDDDWREAESDIRAFRSDARARTLSYEKDLLASSVLEVRWQSEMWRASYAKAYETARSVCDLLTDKNLKGYHAFWSYLAGCSAFLAAETGAAPLKGQASAQFRFAANTISGLDQLVLPNADVITSAEENDRRIIQRAVQGMEVQFGNLGISSNKKYDAFERVIRDGLNQNKSAKFEQALVNLGILMGYQSGKIEADASPDPWWLIDDACAIVFEAHSDGSSGVLGASKAREAEGHKKWMRSKIVTADADIYSVILTDAEPNTEGAEIQLQGLFLWKLSDFRQFATEALATLRELRRECPGRGNIVWRSAAADLLKARSLDPIALIARIKSYAR